MIRKKATHIVGRFNFFLLIKLYSECLECVELMLRAKEYQVTNLIGFDVWNNNSYSPYTKIVILKIQESAARPLFIRDAHNI